jgi:membrane protease YdiL (CAAX protease family)
MTGDLAAFSKGIGMTIALEPQSTPTATPAHSAYGRLSGWIRAHPLLAFVGLSYALSWGYWLPLILTGQIVRLGATVTQFPGLLGPMVAAFLVTSVTQGRTGMLDLLRRVLRWRVPARWWLFALGSPAALAGVAVLVMAFGPAELDLGGFSRMAGLPEWGVVFVWLMFVVVNGLGEETGWRGYALPILRRRHGTLAASILLVPIWAGWHLPLFFLLQSYRDLGLVGLPGFLLGLACGSIVLAWLYESASSSILIAAAWHGTYNLTVATAAGSGKVAAVVSVGVMVGAAAIAWRDRRVNRIDRRLPQTDP